MHYYSPPFGTMAKLISVLLSEMIQTYEMCDLKNICETLWIWKFGKSIISDKENLGGFRHLEQNLAQYAM